jgi:hypothetical protein
LIRNGEGRFFVMRRSSTHDDLPGAWDIVGTAIADRDETHRQTLTRAITSQTGWKLRHVIGWADDDPHVVFVVEVDGDLTCPKLIDGQYDMHAWIGLDNIDLLTEQRDRSDRHLRDLVARKLRFARMESAIESDDVHEAGVALVAQVLEDIGGPDVTVRSWRRELDVETKALVLDSLRRHFATRGASEVLSIDDRPDGRFLVRTIVGEVEGSFLIVGDDVAIRMPTSTWLIPLRDILKGS